MYTYICENSIDGILTGIYTAYADRHPLRDIHLSVGEGMTLSLFTQYIEVTPDPVKAAKVANTLKSRFGQDFYETIYQAAMSGDVPGKSMMTKPTRSLRRSPLRSPPVTAQAHCSPSVNRVSTASLSCAARPGAKPCICSVSCAFRNWRTASCFPKSIRSTMYCRFWAIISRTVCRKKIL